MYSQVLTSFNIRPLVQGWLHSDVPNFDVGGFVVGDKEECAFLLGKSEGVIAGTEFAQAVFDEFGLKVEWIKRDGEYINADEAKRKEKIAIVKGPVRNILLAERTALNVMSRASGIATQAKRVTDLVKGQGWKGTVAGTRKTTPGFSLVEKQALLVGGASTHRMTLSQMVMLKDNHIWSHGSITKAVQKARSACGFSSKIEVECQSLEEAVEAANAGAEIVMLDNFDPEDLKRDAKVLKEKFPHLTIEASGGITETTISSYVCPHVDVVSMGKLTQGYPCLDFSLKVQRQK